MPKRYRPQEVIRVLEHLGWVMVRQRGDHVRLVLPDGRNPVTVPTSRREVDSKTMSSILRQAGLTRRHFESIAEEIV